LLVFWAVEDPLRASRKTSPSPLVVSHSIRAFARSRDAKPPFATIR
jgi:hypothetical protein